MNFALSVIWGSVLGYAIWFSVRLVIRVKPLHRFRQQWRLRRDNVGRLDVIAAIEAAAAARDLRLAWQLGERYLIPRCANCGGANRHRRKWRWWFARKGAAASPYKLTPQDFGQAIVAKLEARPMRVRANDPGLDIVGVCVTCHHKTLILPDPWHEAKIDE